MWITPKDKNDTPRSQSKLERFFDQQTKAQALVRESIQNSFDALPENSTTLKVDFTFKEIEKKTFIKYMNGEDNPLTRHLKECGIDTQKKYNKSLFIEDYFTEGLTGPLDKSKWTDDNKPVSGNFIGFWWSDGISQKGKGSAGSHGVGKITLSTSSDLKTFFALSKRMDDDLEILLGYSQLKYHFFDRKAFQEHSRYGKRIEQGIFPFDSENDIAFLKRFKEDFSLDRSSQTGTSIIIPSVNEEITFTEIIRATILEYFMPIMKGELIANINDGDLKVTIEKDSLFGLTKKYLKDTHLELITDAHEVLSKITEKDFIMPKFDSDLGKINDRRLQEFDLYEEDLKKAKSEFSKGKFVGILIPVEITIDDQDDDEKKISSRFYVFVKYDENSNLKRSANFIRDKLLINKESVSISRNYSSAFLYIMDKELSEFLKFAEDPGHEKWVYKTLYENGNVKRFNDTPLRLIKSVVVDFFNILAGIGDDEKITGVLPEIFSIKEKKKMGEGGGGNPPPPDRIKAISTSPYVIGRQKNGYIVKSSKDMEELVSEGLLELPFNLKIELRYEKLSGSKSHSENDFNLENEKNFPITYEGISILEIKPNELKVRVEKSDFRIENSGFDQKRDLVVKCILE